jgi:kynureninase
MISASINRDTVAGWDAADPLRPFREEFDLPDSVIYLDGNSLGARPKAALPRLLQILDEEWGRDLIAGWTRHDWTGMPERIGTRIAKLIGAGAGEVTVADSTSINLFKALCAARQLAAPRREILAVADDFPTNLHIAQGVARIFPDVRLRILGKAALPAALGPDTAAVMMTQANFRTGELHDMADITARVQRHGALMIWDLSHTAGVLPIALNGCHVDLAVGCGYKYLNGGPGAPAYLFVAERHQTAIDPPLSGWMGHAAPFDFDPVYKPAPGIRRHLAGTPAVLSLAALETGIAIAERADLVLVREKSRRMGELFVARMKPLLESGAFRPGSPAGADQRGSQICFLHADAARLMQRLAQDNVIGDFRPPDVMRFGFAPLYNRYVEVWDAVEMIRKMAG